MIMNLIFLAIIAFHSILLLCLLLNVHLCMLNVLCATVSQPDVLHSLTVYMCIWCSDLIDNKLKSQNIMSF
jgi:hypothetical protein